MTTTIYKSVEYINININDNMHCYILLIPSVFFQIVELMIVFLIYMFLIT